MSNNAMTSPCTNCGADLEFKPGTSLLACPYCGTQNEIDTSEDTVVEESDFRQTLEKLAESGASQGTLESITVKCETCGAAVSLGENRTAGECAFCGSAINAQSKSTKVLKPKYLLPFKVTKDEAADHFRHWLKKRWFAPKKLKTFARADGLKGIYSPFWTYDSETVTEYKGQRGEHYYTTETYTTTEDGKSVTRTRQVQHTRWYRCSGRVENTFDDILVHGSDNMDAKYVDRLEPWGLEELIPYNSSYLTGFQVESYSIDLEQGFSTAKGKMASAIDQSIRRDIGGDEQRINWKNTIYNSVSFKHILLPVWISSYKFKDKVYQFMVNARTGEVQGRRPWSAGKIIIAVLGVLAAAAVLVFLFNSL